MEALFLIAFIVVIALIVAAFFSSSSFDKGAAGERRIYRRLAYFEERGWGKLLSNIYVPKINGGTSEIDLVLIHPKGLFVFESKNYSGWIFGDEAHQYWTQILPAGRHVRKERFYNPVLQNASHIKHLMYFNNRKDIPIWSIIVFSDRCELKDITVRSKNVRIVQWRNVAATVEQICNDIQLDFLSNTEVLTLYTHLFPYTNTTEEEKQRHARTAFDAKMQPPY